MRLASQAVLFALASVPTLQAQSLAIGVIEIKVGQPVATALADLRSRYDVSYDDTGKVWRVLPKRSGDEAVLGWGSFPEVGGKVWSITKEIRVADPYEVVPVYTLAMDDIRTRGGKRCTTVPLHRTDGRWDGVYTACGPYSLALTFPSRDPTLPGDDKRVGAIIRIHTPRERK